MSENLARNEPVRSTDIKALLPEDIIQLRQQGDPYLHQLVAEHDRKRQRYLGQERERER
jgi:hypothetical protein